MSELLIARNPSPESRLGYLIRLPVDGGTVFRTSDTWPRTRALFCYQVSADEWPAEPEIVERVALRSCVRRGAAIDVIADRGRESRSQIVYTKARGRDVVFWQAPRTRKHARPNVRVPTARASGLTDLQIVVDAHERYPYTFADRQATTVRRSLPCGDYGLIESGRSIASVERKSLPDLVSGVTNGKLRFALAELAALPRAAVVVVEERYSAMFKLDFIRPAVVAEGLAELQVRYPIVPIVFCETRALAAEWTYRFLGAARVWAETEAAIAVRPDIAGAFDDGTADGAADPAPPPPEPETAEVRRWAKAAGLEVTDRGRLKPSVWAAWHLAHRR